MTAEAFAPAVTTRLSAVRVVTLDVVATVLLVWAGLSTPDSLIAKRPYVVVGCFIVGMVLTPPDVFSQTMLAVPMWLLFEIGVIASRWVVRDRESREAEDPA